MMSITRVAVLSLLIGVGLTAAGGWIWIRSLEVRSSREIRSLQNEAILVSGQLITAKERASSSSRLRMESEKALAKVKSEKIDADKSNIRALEYARRESNRAMEAEKLLAQSLQTAINDQIVDADDLKLAENINRASGSAIDIRLDGERFSLDRRGAELFGQAIIESEHRATQLAMKEAQLSASKTELESAAALLADARRLSKAQAATITTYRAEVASLQATERSREKLNSILKTELRLWESRSKWSKAGRWIERGSIVVGTAYLVSRF